MGIGYSLGLILKHTVLLHPLKSHQLSGLVYRPRSWLCSVSTGLAQNLPASWPNTTFLLHQSGLDWTKCVPARPACPVNPSVTLPKTFFVLSHKFSPQELPHCSGSLFSLFLFFHSHLSHLCHFLPLHLLAMYLFSHHAVYFFFTPPVSSPGSLQKKKNST